MSTERELAEVLALLEKATPGEWVPGRLGTIQRTNAAGRVASCIAVTGGNGCMYDGWEENTLAIAAAVNFLRKHGPALLSRTPAGEDARDAERYRRWRLLAASGTMSDEVCDMMIAARTEADVDAAIDASMPTEGSAP